MKLGLLRDLTRVLIPGHMTISSKFLHVGECKTWAVMQMKDIPAGLKRSRSSATVEIAVRRHFDLKSLPWHEQKDWMRSEKRMGDRYATIVIDDFFKHARAAAYAGLRNAAIYTNPPPHRNPVMVVNPAYDIGALREAGIMKDCPPKRPRPVTYDGLRPEECYKRYVGWQDENSPYRRGGAKLKDILTPAQLEAAQKMWSAKVKEKTKESEIKERDRVKVDLEFEEWE